jgi:hypothetical protein
MAAHRVTAAGQLVFGAIPAYGLPAGTAGAAALPLFLLAWANVITGIPVCRAAYRTLMLPSCRLSARCRWTCGSASAWPSNAPTRSPPA